MAENSRKAGHSRWGSPHLKDPTARLERVFNSALEKLEGIRRDTLPEVVNRPPGSEKVPREEMLRDYGMVGNDPALLSQRLEEMIEQQGDYNGRLMFIQWIEDMEEGS